MRQVSLLPQSQPLNLDSVPALAALLFITMFSFLSMDSVTNRLHDLAMKLEDEEYEEINWTDPKD